MSHPSSSSNILPRSHDDPNPQKTKIQKKHLGNSARFFESSPATNQYPISLTR